jgi:hypothetical protein
MKLVLPLLLAVALAMSPAALAGKKDKGGGGGKAKAGGGAARTGKGLRGGGLGHQGKATQPGAMARQSGLKHDSKGLNQGGMNGAKMRGGLRQRNHLNALSGKGANRQLGLRRQALHTRNFNRNLNHRLHGALRTGSLHVQRYSVVRYNYRVVYHERYWWRSHYNRIVLVGGGWYYWNVGYWYPAWGYDPGFAFYAYDGPIYSYDNLPPDQVILNIQSELQFEGYYDGPIDGLLGPETRTAIADYQHDHDLEITSAADEPTVESLGLT